MAIISASSSDRDSDQCRGAGYPFPEADVEFYSPPGSRSPRWAVADDDLAPGEGGYVPPQGPDRSQFDRLHRGGDLPMAECPRRGTNRVGRRWRH